jgi:hypothetical protein
VEAFHGDEGIVCNQPSLNKCRLFLINDIWKNMFDSIGYAFSNNLHQHVTKAYGSIVFRSSGIFIFGNKSQESLVYVIWRPIIVEDIKNQTLDILSYDAPILLKEQGMQTIRTGGL